MAYGTDDYKGAQVISPEPTQSGGIALNHNARMIGDTAETLAALQAALLATTAYTYIQTSPASTWIITHTLNRNPSVTIVDSAGTVVYGEITYNSITSVTIVFSGAFAGRAYLN